MESWKIVWTNLKMDRWTEYNPVSPDSDALAERFPLSGEQKVRLMRLALQESSSNKACPSEDEKSDLLLDILNSRIPIQESEKDQLPQVLVPLCGKLRSLTGKRIGEMLTDPQTPLSLLTRIHDYSKQAAAVTKSEMEKDVFFAVYCGAIASALRHHAQKITQHRLNILQEYLTKLSNETWIPLDIKALFSKTINRCNPNESSTP
jgi:hypothetical protein